MIFLFSGFGSDFCQNLSHFARSVRGHRRVALLLQGGPGYEQYLESYLKPLNLCGLSNVSIVVPDHERDKLSEESIKKIEESDGVFIGGGITRDYQRYFCRDDLREVLRSKRDNDVPVAGLSAGAKIMNSSVFIDQQNVLPGLGFISETEIFPHFDEDGYAREAIEVCNNNPGRRSLGLDTNCMIAVGPAGNLSQFGSGKAFWIESDGRETRVKIAF